MDNPFALTMTGFSCVKDLYVGKFICISADCIDRYRVLTLDVEHYSIATDSEAVKCVF